MTCGYKVIYSSLQDAEAAYHRTPRRPNIGENGPLLPYYCERHGGFHLGHFTRGQAWKAWAAEIYARVFQR